MKHPGSGACPDAFTLIELLTVVAVVVSLAALAFPAVKGGLKSAKKSQSLQNMKQITSGLLMYAAENNGQFPSMKWGGGWLYSWELQIFPYLGIPNGFSENSFSPTLEPGLKLNLFCCPLDQRKVDPTAAFYPRSYGLTGVTVVASPSHTGGIPGRQEGEGIRLSQISKPGSYVLLCRVPRRWEDDVNVIGLQAFNLYDGPDPRQPGGNGWLTFDGKTPYAFADGHVGLFAPADALQFYPFEWNASH